jgi:outer membrane protein
MLLKRNNDKFFELEFEVKYRIIFISFLFLMSVQIYSQQKISLKEAIATALQNNYDIKLAKNDLSVVDNNVSLGGAGFLPKLDLTASQTKTTTSTQQEYSSGASVDKPGAKTTSTNAALALTWTLFDGLKMFTTFSKLKEYRELGEMKLRAQLENSIADVIKTYYNIVTQEYILNAAKESVQISGERVKLVEDKVEIGSASRFDLLRAKADLNSDKSTMLNQEVVLSSLKVTFNNLLARNAAIDFSVDENIEVKDGYVYDELKEKAFKNNIDLLQAEKNKSLSKLDVSLSKVDYFPKLILNSGFSYSNAEYEVGLYKKNSSKGLSYGLSLSWNLFNGFTTQRDYENALITLDKNELLILSAKSDLETTLLIAYRNFTKNIDILKLEEENVSVAKENLDLAVEQLKLGTLSAIDFRDVQKNYLDAQSRLYTAYYSAKISERDLLKQSGILMQ